MMLSNPNHLIAQDTENPFSDDTVKFGDALLDEISESLRNKWQDMIKWLINYYSMVKEARSTSHKEKIRPTQDATESMLTSPFQMDSHPKTRKRLGII